jgi:hypothetical protein
MNTGDCFTKLNLDFSDTNLNVIPLNFGYNFEDPYTGDNNFKVFHTEDNIQDYIKSKLPESFRPLIRRVRILVMESGQIPPHQDFELNVVINFYSTNGNAQTTFWSAKEGSRSVPHPKHPTDRRADIFSIDDLVEKCSVIFEQNSCYLLNVSQIHSVDIEKDCVRKVIQLTFNPDVTYNMVVDRLTELNLIEETE